MSTISNKKIESALRQITAPHSSQDIVSAGMIDAMQVDPQGHVMITIQVDPAQGSKLEPLRQAVERTIKSLEGVTKVTAVLTAEKQEGSSSPDPHGMNKNPPLDLPIRKIIAVASGKGGVGKSTVAANLAVSLARKGYKTGLMDADIYGPSQPLMMGLKGQKPALENNKLEPLVAHEVKVMSIGFMVNNDEALIWRGPMVQTAVYQMLRDVNWGNADALLDILVVDMPPGTGDAQLTMAQKVPLDGGIIVSTPQDIALIDARKAVKMFEKTRVPILGVIENMSYHRCTSCGHEDHIFGHGGAIDAAQEMEHVFLGALPLLKDIRIKSDSGEPFMAGDHIVEVTDMFDNITDKITDRLEL